MQSVSRVTDIIFLEHTALVNSSLFAPLPPEAYWQPDWLARERQEVFFKHWIFAGFKNQLAQANDYISFTIAGMPVVVRNMNGKLVAFRNVCSHRYSVIHPTGCGNAMFRCPYHGWTYDAEGVPFGVPDNAKSFGFDNESKRELALDRLAVDICGNFVFARVDAEGPPLKQWLGTFADPLEHISEVLTTVYWTIDQRWSCNWKNRVEVIAESYHVPMVHKATMLKQVDGLVIGGENQNDLPQMDAAVRASDHEEDVHEEYTGPHSASFTPLRGPVLHHLDSIAKRLHLPFSRRLRGYDHFMLFPNMMFGINGGVNMCVERYEPVTPEQTDIHCWLMVGTSTKPGVRDGQIWKTVTKQWIAWTEQVLAEDRGPCESSQSGVHYAQHRALLGKIEGRVRHYQTTLREDVERQDVTAPMKCA